jgi:hypothetical protein
MLSHHQLQLCLTRRLRSIDNEGKLLLKAAMFQSLSRVFVMLGFRVTYYWRNSPFFSLFEVLYMFRLACIQVSRTNKLQNETSDELFILRFYCLVGIVVLLCLLLDIFLDVIPRKKSTKGGVIEQYTLLSINMISFTNNFIIHVEKHSRRKLSIDEHMLLGLRYFTK